MKREQQSYRARAKLEAGTCPHGAAAICRLDAARRSNDCVVEYAPRSTVGLDAHEPIATVEAQSVFSSARAISGGVGAA